MFSSVLTPVDEEFGWTIILLKTMNKGHKQWSYMKSPPKQLIDGV